MVLFGMKRWLTGALALALMLCVTTMAGAATTLLPINHSFEADTFGTFPGYSSTNGPITGWVSSTPTNTGINPGPSSPFANNGTIPDGSQVAFIQGGPARTLSQNITGLTAGNQYVVVYRENARNPNAGVFASTTFGGTTVVANHNVAPVGGANPYAAQVGSVFTATSDNHTLAFVNNSVGDNTVLIDTVLIHEFAPDEGVVAGYNYGFEFDAFATAPGYTAANGPITGWTVTGNGGINPGPTSPFANNGATPEGSQVAFLQANGGTSSLSTTVSNLTPGETYQLELRLNMRSSFATPSVQIDMGGSTLLGASAIDAVGGSNPYHYATLYFVAGAASETLEISNVAAAGDSTLLIDAVSVTPSTPKWTTSAWTGDGDSGINAGGTYTHAYNFGTAGGAPATTINGVDFAAAPNALPSNNAAQPGGDFSLNGYTNVTNDAGNNVVGGGSATLASSFAFNGNPGALELTGLVAGSTNVLTMFAVGWDPAPGRTATFANGDERITVDENALGNNNGQIIQYRYTANSDGVATIDISPFDGLTFHLYGFANEATSVITDLYNTGVDAGGTPQAHNSLDTHWDIVSAPVGGTAGDPRVLTSAGGFPIVPWLGDNTESAWIGPNTDDDSNDVPGSYTYETTFTLPEGFNIAEIIGRYSVDNLVTDVVLNGNSLGITSGNQFNAWTDFVIGADAPWVEGLNTLQFLVNNGAPTGPTGLRVEFTSAVAGFVPTPGALPAGLAMLAAVGARRRRRR